VAEQPPKDEKDLLNRIGVPVGVEYPSAFELLGVPADCEDDQRIRDRAKELSKTLKLWEQYRADPKVQKIAIAVKLQIAGAEQKLRTAEGRKKYRQELLQGRTEKFRQRIREVAAPGEELTPDRLRQLLAMSKPYGLDEAAARKIIQEALSANNPFAVLGIKPVVGDETWPTAFDILQFEESADPPVAEEIQKRIAEQLRRLDIGLKTGKVDADQAARIRLYIQEARNTFDMPEITRAYLRGILTQRAERFANLVKVAVPRPGQADTTTLIQLVHQGRKMRLGQQHIEKVLERVAAVKLGQSVGGDPVLGVSRTEIEAYVRGDGYGGSETLCVRNEGSGSMMVTVESSAPWIEVTGRVFTVETRKDLLVRFPPSRLTPGQWQEGTLFLRSKGGDAEVTVRAILGAPGARAVMGDDFDEASNNYKWIVLLLFSLLALSWKFMINRKVSSFMAFHAMQAMFLECIVLAAIALMWLARDRATGAPPAILEAVFFVLWLILPLVVRKMVKDGRNIQLPLLSPLVKKLL
jgi:uncharacterized membrane protein